MVQAHELRHGLRVIAADGRPLGTVDAADTAGLRLARNSTADGRDHHIAAEWIERVEDDAVYLKPDYAQATNASPAAAVQESKSMLPWLLGAIAAIVLLGLLLRGCEREPPVDRVTLDPAPAGAVRPTAMTTVPVALPGGRTIQLARDTLPFQVQAYLATPALAPRTFAFERLNFDSGRAEVRAEERADIDNLAQVLTAYPAVRVRVVGYTDARGGEQPNAELGLERARSVAAALTEKGVAATRIETVSGGENDPRDTNATSGGRLENRRTELIVTSR